MTEAKKSPAKRKAAPKAKGPAVEWLYQVVPHDRYSDMSEYYEERGFKACNLSEVPGEHHPKCKAFKRAKGTHERDNAFSRGRL